MIQLKLNLLNEHKRNIVFIILIEFVFVFLLFFSTTFTYDELINGYDTLQSFSSTLSVGSESQEDLLLLENNLESLDNVLNKMFFLVVHFGLFILIVSSLLLGMSALLGYRCINKKKFSVEYFLKFGLLFFIWMIIFSLVIWVINFLLASVTGVIIFWLILLFVFYFTLVSFSSF